MTETAMALTNGRPTSVPSVLVGNMLIISAHAWPVARLYGVGVLSAQRPEEIIISPVSRRRIYLSGGAPPPPWLRDWCMHTYLSLYRSLCMFMCVGCVSP